MHRRTDSILLGDIGATNARLALLTQSGLGPVMTYEVARFPRFTELLDCFLKQRQNESDFNRAVFAIAAPIDGGRSTFTNCPWVIDVLELQATFGLDSQLYNDFEAVAHSLPSLGPGDLASLGGGAANDTSPRAVLGPGTGLGAACLLPRADRLIVIQSEGGHATLAGSSDREDEIIRHLRGNFGHVSAERAVSGPGLENIYRTIGALEKQNTPLQNAAQITDSALRGECGIAVEALKIFCGFLGSFAGNVALTFGARGGVFIAGGIAPRIVDFLRRSQFRVRFEAKGRFRDYLKSIPVHVITHPKATFLGLSALIGGQAERWPPRGQKPSLVARESNAF